MISLIDDQPLRPGWGHVYQGSELDALLGKIQDPWAIVSMVGMCAFGPAVCIAMLDDETDTLPDDLLRAIVICTLTFLASGRNVLIHCFEGKYRSTYMDVAVHMGAGMTFDLAFNLVKQKHPIADLRAGTSAQLKRMESILQGEITT